MKYFILLFPILFLVILLGVGQEKNLAEKKAERITLTKTADGRHWLVHPDGNPFFAHGITHANVQRANPPIDKTKFSKLCKELGFNAYGYGCPPQLKSDMPYIESWSHLVQSAYYREKNGVKFVDIFDPEEQERLDAGVKFNCALGRASRQNIIGYCWTDLGSWPLKNPSGTNWVEYIRNLPEDAPGQKTYRKFLSTSKGNDDTARDQEFLRLIAREYFRVVGEANRKYDPGALVFGDRFAFNTFDSVVVKEMLPWVDGIAIQPSFWGPFPKEKFDEIHKITGKPIIVCDFAIRFNDGNKDIKGWKAMDNSVVGGKAYADYVKAALKTDYILGVFWCNPVDTPKGFGKAGVKQGFFGEGLTERPGLHKAVKELNKFRDKLTSAAGKGLLSATIGKTEHAKKNGNLTPREASMIKELNLTEKQRPRFLKIQRTTATKWAEFQKMPEERRVTEEATYYKARNAELTALLTPKQMTILREIRRRRNSGKGQGNKGNE